MEFKVGDKVWWASKRGGGVGIIKSLGKKTAFIEQEHTFLHDYGGIADEEGSYTTNHRVIFEKLRKWEETHPNK